MNVQQARKLLDPKSQPATRQNIRRLNEIGFSVAAIGYVVGLTQKQVKHQLYKSRCADTVKRQATYQETLEQEFSPEVIAERCAEIRAGWSEKEHKRRHWRAEKPLEITEVGGMSVRRNGVWVGDV